MIKIINTISRNIYLGWISVRSLYYFFVFSLPVSKNHLKLDSLPLLLALLLLWPDKRSGSPTPRQSHHPSTSNALPKGWKIRPNDDSYYLVRSLKAVSPRPNESFHYFCLLCSLLLLNIVFLIWRVFALPPAKASYLVWLESCLTFI